MPFKRKKSSAPQQGAGGGVQSAQAPTSQQEWPASQDPNLPGVAGYPLKRGKMPNRFNYVRPDGQPDQPAKRPDRHRY